MLCVIGPSGAGKSTVAAYLHRKYGYIHIEASEYMMSRYYDAKCRGALLRFVDRTFREQGKDVIAHDVLRSREEHGWDPTKTVVSGFRTVEEIALVTTTVGDTLLLGIDAHPEVRFQRSLTRRRPGATSDYAKFLAKDMHEWAWGLADLMGHVVPHVLSNDGTFTQLFTSVDRYLNSVLSAKRR